MKFMSAFTMSCQPILLLGILTVLLAGVTAVASDGPQPITEDNKSQTSDAQLPPKRFPKENGNGSILQNKGELPPLLFPGDDSTHAILTTMSSNKSDLRKKDLNKETEHDETEPVKPNKTLSSSKTSTDASEVPDLMKDYMNITVYEDGAANPLNNDTETVDGPRVIKSNKTHDEEITKSSVEMKTSTSIPTTTLQNETTENTQTNEKNSSGTDISSKDTIDDHVDEKNNLNMTSPSTKVPENTDTGDKQNSTQSSVPFNEGTENVNNVTAENPMQNESESETLETKNVENETSTLEYNTTMPNTEKVTTTPMSKNNSVEIKDKETADNRTTDKNDTVETKTTETTPLSTNETITTIPTLKAESTTSVDISENIIDHKADSPYALQHADHSHTTSGKSSAFLQPTESAAILAGVFVGIALLGYVGLLIWRRVLEKRYGNREMLVNEDDFYDSNDLRNFEL